MRSISLVFQSAAARAGIGKTCSVDRCATAQRHVWTNASPLAGRKGPIDRLLWMAPHVTDFHIGLINADGTAV
jgi:hypothetical protein